MIKYKYIFLLLTIVFMNVHAWAQGKDKVIQLSGLVVCNDSLYGVFGAHLYVPKTGRGTSTNGVGFFSMPVVEGDSLVITAIGYKQQSFKVPYGMEDKVSLMVDLKQDTLLQPVIDVFPYYTEELFKQAFLALKLPDQQYQSLNYNLSDRVMASLYAKSEMDGSMNHKYFMQQQAYKQETRFQAPSISLLNPFAWAQFIQSVKRGDFKKKKYKDEQ
ncbi:MAG: hypothetical protein RL711_104 [Bacteroidota bacterium]